MRNVSNKRCIYNLCIKNMKANLRRNIMIICAVVLTTIMMTTLFSIGGSVLIEYQNNTMYQIGTSSMAGFKFMTEDEYQKLEADSKISNLSYSIYVGTASNAELYEDYSEVRYVLPLEAQTSFCEPTTGHLPEKEKEIATCTKVLDDLGVKHELGATVHLTIDTGEEELEGDFILSGYWDKPADILVNQIYVSKEYQEKYAPVWKTEADKKANLDKGIYSGCLNPNFDFATAINLEKQMADLKSRLGFGDDVNDGINWAFAGSTIDFNTVAMIVLILALIIGSGYLIIFNIFYIAVSSEVQYYGLLKTIGLTNKQLKKMVVLQGDILSIVGIPLGLLMGYIISIELFPMVAETLQGISGVVYPDARIFLFSAVFSWITVRMSCRKPGKVISQISPVEAVRYSEYKGEKLAAKRKTRKVTPWTMAQENLKRNFKKTAVVVLSLALSIILINATVSVTEGFDAKKYLAGSINSDFMITDASILNPIDLNDNYERVNQDTVDYISSLDGVTETGLAYMSTCVQHINDVTLGRVEKFYNENGTYMMPQEDYDEMVTKGKMIPAKIFGIDELPFNELEICHGQADWEKFQSGNYVIVTHPDMYEGKSICSFYNVGEKALIEFPSGNKKEYEVLAIGELPFPMGPEYSDSIGFSYILPRNEYLTQNPDAAGAMKLFVNVDEAKTENIENEISKYCETDVPELAYTSRAYYMKDF